MSNFTVTLGDQTVYEFDLALTYAVAAPPFSTIIQLGADGEVIDIQGALTLPGTISQILLGRDGNEGTYADVQQTSQFNSRAVSWGTYSVELVPIPEPSTASLLALGLVGIATQLRRRAGPVRREVY